MDNSKENVRENEIKEEVDLSLEKEESPDSLEDVAEEDGEPEVNEKSDEENEEDDVTEKEEKPKKKKKEKKKLSPKALVKRIIAVMIGAVALLALLVWLLESVVSGNNERETVPPVDPLDLHETKPEDFDIMEYDEYLKLNRTVFLYDKHSNVTQSISEEDCDLYGEGVGILYRVIMAIQQGDEVVYNYYMGNDAIKKESFTQQQIYDIEISLHSTEAKNDGAGSYTEYTYKVTYRIHENNGTYRNTIKSDVSRPQYFIINDSEGKLLVMDIVEQVYKK